MSRPDPSRQVRLGAFLPAHGHHVAAWRNPGTPADAGHDFQHYKRLALAAEAAGFDALFLADAAATWSDTRKPDTKGLTGNDTHFEPITLLSALAAITQHIGLVATVTTTYNEPYHLARKFASLDHISGGRAGWNLVTSANAAEAANFGVDAHLEHGLRYEKAEEFIDVVTGLWDSWEDDAFQRDQTSGQNYDPAKLHILNHQGKHYKVRGPLNVARSPQGHPVKVQAGSSEPGKELAARTAEVVFTAHQTLALAQEFYRDLKGRLAKFGRSPDELKVFPGLFPVVAPTREEAQAKFAAIQDLTHPSVGLSLLSGMIGGFDLTGHDLDGPLPELPESNGGKSRQALLYELARRENLSIRQLYQRTAGARGHKQLVGTPTDIADHIQEWFEAGAADGFNIMPPTLPDGLTDFINLVLPELRRRGLFRTAYEGRTLRDNLGLARPGNSLAKRVI
jgi:N-acetyl-S-(2-succino)cysteine monooxygenase